MPDQIDNGSNPPAEEPATKPTGTAEVQLASPPASAASSPAPEPVVIRPPQAPPPYQTPPAQPYGYAPATTSNGMATTGGVLGIVGFVVGWIPLFGILFGLVLGICAVVFSGIGLSRSSRLPGQAGRGLAITGLVLGILIIVLKLIPGINVL